MWKSVNVSFCEMAVLEGFESFVICALAFFLMLLCWQTFKKKTDNMQPNSTNVFCRI